MSFVVPDCTDPLSATLTRKALRDFRFSDGTLIPSGTLVSAAARATHFDPENYENPDTFDPWRFVKLSGLDDADMKGSTNHALVDTNPAFLAFGLGRHAWSVLSFHFALLGVFTVFD